MELLGLSILMVSFLENPDYSPICDDYTHLDIEVLKESNPELKISKSCQTFCILWAKFQQM